MNSRVWSKVLCMVCSRVGVALGGPDASKTGPKYDVASEVKVKGVIEDIREFPRGGRYSACGEDDTKTILVYVAWDFLKEIEVSFSKATRSRGRCPSAE